MAIKLRTRKTSGTRLHRVYFFLWDGIYDPFFEHDAPDWVSDALDSVVVRPSKWVLCQIYGHEPERDQCGMPEHDFCLWCNRSMPYMAEPAIKRRRAERTKDHKDDN